jgi:hypothetical protein
MRKFTAILGMSGFLLAAAPAYALDQDVRVFTWPAVDAHCVLENEAGAWTVQHTPMSASVDRAHGGLSVSCRSADGLWSGHVVASAGIDAAVVLTAPMNLAELAAALGGAPSDLHGAGEAIGAAFGYPGGIVVPMRRDKPLIADAVPVEPAAAAEPAPPLAPAKHRPLRHHARHSRAKPACRHASGS